METIEIDLIRLFVKVIQHGSFSKAADSLRIPKSTVSKSISRLESVTGTKLLLRTTRSQTLTAAGRAFYETCLGPIQVLEEAQKSLHGQENIVSGGIKLTAPEDMGAKIIAPAIGELSRLHPGLEFELNYTNDVIDLVRDGYDLAIRIGKLSESNLRSRKVADLVTVVVASPGYIKRAGKPKHPKELREHEAIMLDSKAARWTLKKGKETSAVDFKTRIACNHMTSILQIALIDAGVAVVPHYLCRDELEKGRLIQLLPDWNMVTLPVSMLSPMSFTSSARLKLVSDHLLAALQKGMAVD